jgi:hypothetical protein
LPQADAIFDRRKRVNGEADASEDTLRLSLAAKAGVKIGPFSQGGRPWAKVEASDHDFHADATRTPVGILLPRDGEWSLYFAQSALTSAVLVDVVERWWQTARGRFPKVKTLLINQDNGPEISRRRTQYVKRLRGFAEGDGG